MRSCNRQTTTVWARRREAPPASRDRDAKDNKMEQATHEVKLVKASFGMFELLLDGKYIEQSKELYILVDLARKISEALGQDGAFTNEAMKGGAQ